MKTENRPSHVPKPLLTNDKSSFIDDRKRSQGRQESALQPSKSHLEDGRKPSQGRQNAIMRMTEAYHENNRKPPCSNKKQAARWTPPRSTFHFLHFTFHFRRTHFSFPTGRTFHFALFTFHFKRRNSPFDSLLLPYITPIQCSTYGARMAVKMPLRVRPSEA